MDQRTRQLLASAERNQSFASMIARDYDGDPPSLEWAVVIAFYAAVHYVNAFLWEIAQVDPANHEDRAFLMSRWPQLTLAIPAYRQMLGLSFQARYRVAYRVDDRLLHRQLSIDLPIVEQAVRSILADR